MKNGTTIKSVNTSMKIYDAAPARSNSSSRSSRNLGQLAPATSSDFIDLTWRFCGPGLEAVGWIRLWRAGDVLWYNLVYFGCGCVRGSAINKMALAGTLCQYRTR